MKDTAACHMTDSAVGGRGDGVGNPCNSCSIVSLSLALGSEMIDLILGNIEWVVMGGLAMLAYIFKARGDKHKRRAEKAEEYNETSKDLADADTFTGGDDAREWLSRRGKS